MSNQLELVAELRVASGTSNARRLRQQGVVPCNMYGHHQPSVSMQASSLALQKLLSHGGKNAVFLVKVGDQAPIQALIKQLQRDPVSGQLAHVDFYQVAAMEKLRTRVQLHFVNEAGSASLGEVTVLRSLSDVMVECLPADLPASIQVDLSDLGEPGDVIRVGNLKVGPGVIILTNENDMVAGMRQQAPKEQTEEALEGAKAAVAG